MTMSRKRDNFLQALQLKFCRLFMFHCDDSKRRIKSGKFFGYSITEPLYCRPISEALKIKL